MVAAEAFALSMRLSKYLDLVSLGALSAIIGLSRLALYLHSQRCVLPRSVSAYSIANGLLTPSAPLIPALCWTIIPTTAKT